MALINSEHKIFVPDLDIDRIFQDYPYYCEKLLRIKTKSKGIAPLAFNNIQKLIWYGKPPDFHTNPIYKYTRLDEGMVDKLLREEPLRYIILKYRQAGVSTFFTSFAFWRTHTNPGHNSLIVAHDLKTTKHLFNDMCKVYYQFLDYRVKPKTNTKNMYELEFKDPKGGLGLESIISTATAGHAGSGHGHTFHTLCLSEISRWPNYESLEGLTQTVPTGDDSVGTSIILESVAKMSGDFFNQKYGAAVEGQSDYTPLFLPWYLHNEYKERIKPNGFELKEFWKDFMEFYSLKEPQVWWYYKKHRELEDENPGRGMDKVRMLYPGNEQEAWMTTGYSAFPEEALNYLGSQCKDPILYGDYIGERFVFSNNKRGKLHIWEKPRGDTIYTIGCLPPGEEIVTNQGTKLIENVKLEDKLLSHEGKWTNIKIITQREHTGEIISIQPSSFPIPFHVTPEHPIYIGEIEKYNGGKSNKWHTEGKWIEAKDVKVGMLVKLPQRDRELTKFNHKEHWEEKLHLNGAFDSKRRNKNNIPSDILYNEEFWWMVGLYLAEGYCNYQKKKRGKYIIETGAISFCLNPYNDASHIERLENFTKNILKRSLSIVKKAPKCYEYVISSSQLCKFLQTFGKGAGRKHLPEWIFSIGNTSLWNLIEGYYNGDGCLLEKYGKISIVSISLQLLRDIQRALLRLQTFSSVSILREEGETTFRGKSYKTKKTWQLNIGITQWHKIPWLNFKTKTRWTQNSHIFRDGDLWVKIGKIERKPYTGLVYNFETESHSYCTTSGAVHNSDISLGRGESESTFCVLAHPGYRQVAEWGDNTVDPKKMAYVLKSIGEYYNNALIIVETNNAGLLTNSTLDDIYTCGNLYEWEYFNRRGNTKSKTTGWQTSQESKRILIGQANSLLSSTPPEVEIYSGMLLNQMKNFIDYGNDVYQPAKNWRSDRCIAWLLAIMAMWRKVARFEDFRDVSPQEEHHNFSPNRDDVDMGDLGNERSDHWLIS